MRIKFFAVVSILGTVLLGGFYFSVFRSELQTLNSSSLSPSVVSGNYCLAIRGNGELEPAHWGAVAKTFEQLGLPRAMAGGSSATITMFWINAVASNPVIQDSGLSDRDRRLRSSLLVKSFLGFFKEVFNLKFTQDFFKLYGQMNNQVAEGMTQKMKIAVLAKNFVTAKKILSEGVQLGVFDEQSIKSLAHSLVTLNLKSSLFFIDELTDSIQRFGKFDAKTDSNLFFRAGLVNFERAAESFARVAAFYSASMVEPDIVMRWQDFVSECAPLSEGESWSSLTQKSPSCEAKFRDLFAIYFKKEPQAKLEETLIGHPISVFATTAVISGGGVVETDTAFAEYAKKKSSNFGKDFILSNSEDLRFGYWGNPSELKLIEQGLDRSDEKSRRFLSLGAATWKEVLSLSPAEPGLAPIKPFQANQQKYYSAGGWSDLQPAPVLRAFGCENVVYLTRRGADSPFAQGVAQRLGGEQVAAQLFDLERPESSANYSLRKSSAVLCTNWNAYNIKKDFVPMIEDAFRSAYWINPGASRLELSPQLQEKQLGCQPL